MRVVPRTSRDPAAAGAEALANAGPAAWEPLTFEEFYRQERPRLVALATALCGRAWADDVAQEAMLVAYRRWDGLVDQGNPEAFVRRVGVNLAVSTYRRRSRQSRLALRLAAERPAPRTDGLRYDDLWQAVRALSSRQAEVVALHYVYDLRVADIATTLGVTEGTVKTLLHRARTALAERLGVEEEEVPR